MNAAEQLISRARQGLFGEVLPQLLAMARNADVSRDEAWEAAAAGIQVLFWQDRFVEAAEVAEAIIAQDGSLGGELCDQDVPFRTAFLGAQAHAGLPAAPRLLAAADRVPVGRNLSEDLLWLAQQLPDRPVEELLPNHADWGGTAKVLDRAGAELAERAFDQLAEPEKHSLWQALAKANDFDRAHALAESSGEAPDRFATCTWLAGWYAVRGDIPRGERVLLAAHSRWWPYKKWDAIPDALVLQPRLRLVVTDRVREYYLHRPIGPESAAESNA